MTKIKRNGKNKINFKLSNILFKSNYFPLILSFAGIGLLFVLFRMKAVEQDYKIHAFMKKIEDANHDNKELEARKARYLSSQHLRDLAEKHNLHAPKQEQIIVIP